MAPDTTAAAPVPGTATGPLPLATAGKRRPGGGGDRRGPDHTSAAWSGTEPDPRSRRGLGGEPGTGGSPPGAGTPSRADAGGPFHPVQVVDVELGAPLPPLCGGTGRLGLPYRTARVLVRLHGVPLGTVEVALDRQPLPAETLAAAIAGQLAVPIADHLRGDLLDALPPGPTDAGELAGLLVGGLPQRLPSGAPPPCASRMALGAGTPLASVVIATCHRPDRLVRCIDSILAGDHPRFEVLVVDNDPSDPSTRVAVDSRYRHDPRVRYVPEPLPGTSAARNAGVLAAAGDIVAFTDDDVTVDRRWLRALTVALLGHPGAGCVTGLTEPAALETPAQVSFERFAGFVGGYRSRTFRLDMRPRPTRLHPFVLGMAGATNNMAMWAGTARSTRFDTRLGPGTPTRGGEDLDLLARILLSGREVVYDPRAFARHEHRSEVAAMRRQAFGYGAGATAVLAKWVIVDRGLRRALLRSAGGVLGTALRGETRPGVPPEARVPPRTRLHQLAGFAAGPVLWARSVRRRPPW